MINAIVKQLDISGDWLETISLDNPEYFGLQITVSIGPDNEEGSEYFNLFICSPEWLVQNEWLPRWGRHMLILRKYDLNEIKEVINKCVEKCTCDTWIETAQKLSRYFAWEFEDYQA